MIERTLSHELGWVMTLQSTIDALWAGSIEPIFTDERQNYRRVIGYIEHGKEVLLDEQPAGLHVS